MPTLADSRSKSVVGVGDEGPVDLVFCVGGAWSALWWRWYVAVRRILVV